MSQPGHKKSVLLLHPFDALAGSQRVAVALARALQGLQVPLEVHLGFGTNGFVSQLAGVHRFLGVNRIPLRKVLYPLWIIAMVPKMVWAACRGSLVWANTVHAIPAALPMLWLAPNRVVLHIHEIEFPRLFQQLLSWAIARGAHVLCVSNLHRRQLDVPADVLPNCVDNGDDTAPLEPPVLLFVGEVSAVKGFPLFVDVARRLSPARVRAVACVPHVPPPRRGWVEAARAANVQICCGLSEPRQMFAGATLLLQCTDPSLWTETFSLVMAESLAFGVPVATAGTAVAPEILGDAWAFDVRTRDPDRIAAEVVALLDDPQRLQALRAAALVRREYFSFDAFQSRVADVLDAVSEERPQHAKRNRGSAGKR
jgi:glycosyltransferase involved in cell wall biosynthesis